MSLHEAYAGLEPAAVWQHFSALNRIPRPSGEEDAAANHLRALATELGARWAEDDAGNTVVYIPASPGREMAPPVVIQAHLDMVCEHSPETVIDFHNDPIVPRREGEWIYASGTTLGSDNGIGVACALALLTDDSLEHGPLELLFTVEEETGLVGAANLEPSLVSSRLMINLDSEDPSTLTIGCAGGSGAVLHLAVEHAPTPPGHRALTLTVSGCKGGHSGVQIHEHLANAIKVLSRALFKARAAGVDFQLFGLQGGNAHNAIPRDAVAWLLVPEAQVTTLNESLDVTREALLDVWATDEPGMRITLTETAAPEAVYTSALRDRLLSLLANLPHGVLKMSHTFAGKVETSSNLAQVAADAARIEIGTSTRSFRTEETERIQKQIRALGEEAGAEVVIRDGYPGWEPDGDSELLRKTVTAYEHTFQQGPPKVEVIHAGLECGVIAARLPGMEAVSFGPRIKDAHTPKERVEISTVERTWKLLTALLRGVSE